MYIDIDYMKLKLITSDSRRFRQSRFHGVNY